MEKAAESGLSLGGENSSSTEKTPQVASKNDYEQGDVEHCVGNFDEILEVRQGLHQRHIQMIALAGTIGTGLFLSSGKAIARSGPLGAFLGYSVRGFPSHSSL